MTDVIHEKPEAAEETGVIRASIEEGQVNLRLAAVGVVRSEEAQMTNAMAGLVLAGRQASLDRAGARTIIAAGPVDIERGGAGMILSAADTTLTRGGGGTIASLGEMHLGQSGAAMLVARAARMHSGSFVGLALTPQLTVESGGRVLAGAREAAVFGLIVSLIVVAAQLVFAGRRRQAAPVAEEGEGR